MSNLAKGRDSYDSTSTGLIAFFNRNVTAYPTEVGGPSFEPIPVERQKDLMVNIARLHGQQEYDRIMELVSVLQKQANSIKRRLEITDAVHAAKYDFQVAHGQTYWLIWDSRKDCSRLCHLGPQDWTTGKPEEYNYMAKVKYLGDYTWKEINEEGNYVD